MVGSVLEEATAHRFQLVAGHSALDFVNTLDNRFALEGPSELLTSYTDVLSFARQSKLIPDAQARGLARQAKGADAAAVLRSAIELRETLARIFYAKDGTEMDLTALRAWLQKALSHRRIHAQGRGYIWRWEDLSANHEAPLWIVAEAAVNLLTSPSFAMVRECGNERCRWLFLDTSKNHSRRWCDMKICGNRIKARRYYARHSELPC